MRTHQRSPINDSSEEKPRRVRGQVQGGNRPTLWACHGKRGSDHLQGMKSVVHNNSSNSPAHGDPRHPSKRTVTQSVAPQSHLRGICCFQQHHADHPDGSCYQGHLRSPAAGGFMQRCHACNRQFGLIRHRWWGYHFCKKTCLNDFLAKRSQQIGRMKDWLSSNEAPAREPSRL
jgi:hypothetical protein